MITEIKHNILVNDFETINESVHEQIIKYRKKSEDIPLQLNGLSIELNEVQLRTLLFILWKALRELEAEYYSSQYKEKPKVFIDNISVIILDFY